MITFNKEKLKEYIEMYKENFERVNQEEIYKWCFVKTFQDNWNIDALNFRGMFSMAVADSVKTPYSGNKKVKNNILQTFRYYPRQFILAAAEIEPETVRKWFRELFDESKDITVRNKTFQEETQEFFIKYKSNSKLSSFTYSYQRNLSVSNFLFLRYPDKYYISKYSVMKDCSQILGANWIPKNADYDNIEKCRQFFDEINKVVLEDTELLALSKKRLQNDLCYPDEEFKILTQDIVWFIVNKVKNIENNNEWWPALKEYDPGISVSQWRKLFNNENVFTKESKDLILKMLDFPDGITCKQLAADFGGEPNYYNNMSWQLAKRVQQVTNCPIIKRLENDGNKYWPILYIGKYTQNKKDGTFLWKLRDELRKALLNTPENDEVEAVKNKEENNKYTKADFLTDVFMTEENYNKLVALLKFKRNIILQGAPGVGKTYAAKRLAYSLIGAEDNSKIAMVQFHQNYSYEDFVMGYRPTENGFELRNGVFYEFCQKARNDLEHNYYFIIDEINRGNLSAIFGELLMLIESDYRNKPVTLVYKKDEQFSVPPNVYIIGMMNTADRSIAMIDYALRRRFSFFTMNPGFDSDGFKRMQSDIDNSVYNDLIAEIKSLNSEIAQDDSLGEGFCIGHSYFVYDNNCRTDVEVWLKNVVEYDILPMLNEYWFDEKTKADNWKNKLMGVFDK